MEEEMMKEEMPESAGIEIPTDGMDLTKYKEGETFELPAKFQLSNGSLTLVEVNGKQLGTSEEEAPEQSESDAMDARIMERAKMADKQNMMR